MGIGPIIPIPKSPEHDDMSEIYIGIYHAELEHLPQYFVGGAVLW